MNDRDQYLSQTQARPLGKHNIPPKTKNPSKIIQFTLFHDNRSFRYIP
jgi:hypothetical protein